MKTSSLTTLTAIVVIGIGAFVAGRISSGGDPGQSAVDKARAAGRGAGDAQPSGRDGSAAGSRRSAHAERTQRGNSDMKPQERLAKLEGIVRGENALDRNRALLAFIDQLSPGDFEDAVAHFRSLGITESRFGEYSLLLSAWAKVDPMAALDYAKANTGGSFATNTILTAWASTDPEAAIQWAQTHHEGDGANPYYASIIRSIAANDPTRATQLLTGMPRSRERGEALDSILPHLVTNGGAAATREWIAALTDDTLREGAMMRAADRLAALDPAGTAAWLAANPGQATQERFDNVYSAWAAKDAQAALVSIGSLASPELRNDALRGVIRNVATSDPKTAVAMMNRFPNDVDDRVIQQFVWHSLGNDPAVAVSQIDRIADPKQREQMYTRAVGSWLDRDATAANAWLRNNPLPPNVQAELNKRAQQLPPMR